MTRAKVQMLLLVFGLALWSGASAELLMPEKGAIRDLVAAKSLKCVFPYTSTVDWDSDDPLDHSRQTMQYQIDGIDYGARKARLIGNVSAVDVIAMRGIDTMAFLSRDAAARQCPRGRGLRVAKQGWPIQSGLFAPLFNQRPGAVAKLRLMRSLVTGRLSHR